MDQKNKKLISITLLGPIKVGKTTLLDMYFGGPFSELSVITVGKDKYKNEIKINDNIYNIFIWDTPGTERLRPSSINCAIHSDIIIYVFDVSNISTLEELKNYIDLVEEQIKNNKYYTSFIIGNKTDLLSEGFNEEKIKELVDINKIKYKLISAKDDISDFKEIIKYLVMEYLGYKSININKSKIFSYNYILRKYLSN